MNKFQSVSFGLLLILGTACGGDSSATPSDEEETDATTAEGTETEEPATMTTIAEEFTSATSIETEDGITVSGTLTAVFNDCDSLWALEDGEPRQQDVDISCDGGSWVRIGNTQIQTSSGFTLEELAYDRHNLDGEELVPGIEVTAMAIDDGSGRLSLDCESCGLSRA